MSDFARKLVSGTVEAPPKTSWWPRHGRAISRYLLLSGSDMSNALESARQGVLVGCLEWDHSISQVCGKGLMQAHAALEMNLVDVSKSNNPAKIDKIGSLLYENAGEIAGALGKAIVEFPEERFRRLMEGHVATFAECVRLKMEGKKPVGRTMDSNTICLAAFSAEWF